MPTRPFHVYALLHDEKHLEPSAREEGLSVLISVQSMMIRVRGYNNLNEFGIFPSICCLLGQMLMLPKAKYKKLAQVIIFLLIVDK